jgi:hypothetical protein
MSDTPDFRTKVDQIFQELVGAERARWLRADVPSRAMLLISEAVNRESDFPDHVAWDIGINVADWQGDAAFLVALHLFPERFTPEEIEDGVRSLLIHVPGHVNAAARLMGHSDDDTPPS